MKLKENNYAFIDSQSLVEYLLEQKKLLALIVPNHKKYSGLLKRKDFLPYTRFVADIRNKVQKKKDPDEDKTSSGHPFRS